MNMATARTRWLWCARSMLPRSDAPADSLVRCRRFVLAALALLLVAGLRHHLFWGESLGLLPWLNAFETACLVGFALLAGLGWWRGMAVAERDGPSLRAVACCCLPVLLLAIVVPPFLTTDPVDYVVRGRVLAIHGGNPYVQVATDFPGDPFLAFGDRAWKSFPLPYGPVVADLQAAIAWLAHCLPLPPRGELIAALLLFKAVFAAALLGAALLFARVAERLRAGSGPRTCLAVAWNPLLLCECVANAHNESLVLLCLAAATAALAGGRLASATLALGVGALTKVVPVLLLPLWGIHALRTGRVRAFGLGLVGIGVLAAGFALQFGDLDGAVAVLARQGELRGASVWWAVHELAGGDLGLLVTIGRAAVVASLLVRAVLVWRRPVPATVVAAAATTLALLAVFGGALFGPWYHTWWLPFALLLERGLLFRCACAVSLLAPLAFGVWTATRRLDGPLQWNVVLLAVVVPGLLAACRWPGPRATGR